MSAASITPAAGGQGRGRGATAIGPAHAHPRHLLGNALRAIRVFAGAAFSVVILGQTDEDRGVFHRVRQLR
ncbi:hypothetical protein [Streptomyces gobiensis]|uniref:hypothetical protein n=1 Tax=Streptomyces gobiensis TaxID=2875706 RepID=UPI001E47B74D|nr:hypothetical protein [Streptomyces gobiensis]UGY92092.1 hypothetical protein test1122_10395 [Streptomyces gobiensis]